MKAPDEKFNALREKALKLLESGKQSGTLSMTPNQYKVSELIHELETYHIELGLQNKELLHSQRELSSSLARMEMMFDSFPFASFIVDRSAVITQSNDLAADIFGFRDKMFLENHSLLRLVAKDDRERVFGSITNVPRDATTQIGPLQIGQKAENLVDFYITRLPDAFHTDRRSLITIVDRTDHYRRLRKLLLLQTLVDTADSRIYAFDNFNRCLFANAKERELIGLSLDEIIGSRRDAWMETHKALELEKQDALVYTTAQNYLYEEKIDNLGEADQYFMTHKFPLVDEEGKILGVGSISTEVTETFEQRDRLNLAMSAYTMGQEAIVITNSDNEIIMVNQAFTDITGYREGEVRGKNPRVLSSGRHPREFFQQMWSDLSLKGYWEGEIWNRRKGGDIYPEWLSISKVVGTTSKELNYIGVFSDITKRKMAEEEIHSLAFFDTLTGLPNRYLLSDRVNQMIHESERKGRGFALLFFDLDEFKQINDAYGHAAGDAVLKEIAERIRHFIRESDTISRLGGDEFVLVIRDIEQQDIEKRAARLLGLISEKIIYDDRRFNNSASIGVAVFPQHGTSFDELMQNADTAMYEAKAAGRNRVRFFNTEMTDKARQQLNIEQALKSDINSQAFSLVYQPICDLRSSRIVGAEALLRWNSTQYTDVSPSVFVPIAEKSGVIHELGRWVFEEAFKTFNSITDVDRDIRMSINVSAVQLESESFVAELSSLVTEFGIDPQRIELEITETMIMKQPVWAMSVMNRLKEQGFRIALDDFGTGYSSMANLRWMPVDTLKIDRSFIMGMKSDIRNRQITDSILQLAQNMGMQTIAEGVEERENATFLKGKQCDLAQGYLFSRPVPKEALLELLQRSAEQGGVGLSDG